MAPVPPTMFKNTDWLSQDSKPMSINYLKKKYEVGPLGGVSSQEGESGYI